MHGATCSSTTAGTTDKGGRLPKKAGAVEHSLCTVSLVHLLLLVLLIKEGDYKKSRGCGTFTLHGVTCSYTTAGTADKGGRLPKKAGAVKHLLCTVSLVHVLLLVLLIKEGDYQRNQGL